jgi:hypothetical protein
MARILDEERRRCARREGEGFVPLEDSRLHAACGDQPLMLAEAYGQPGDGGTGRLGRAPHQLFEGRLGRSITEDSVSMDALLPNVRIERPWAPRAIHRAARFLEGASRIYLPGSVPASAGSGAGAGGGSGGGGGGATTGFGASVPGNFVRG